MAAADGARIAGAVLQHVRQRLITATVRVPTRLAAALVPATEDRARRYQVDTGGERKAVLGVAEAAAARQESTAGATDCTHDVALRRQCFPSSQRSQLNMLAQLTGGILFVKRLWVVRQFNL